MAYPVRSATFFINITSMFINKGGTTVIHSSLTGICNIQIPVRDFFCKQRVMRTRIKLALILVHMTSASNEQRRTKSVSCELPGLGSAEGTERPGLQKSM